MSASFRGYANYTIHDKAEIGDTKLSMKGADHTGWLLCDGRSLNTGPYNSLFQVIGTKYGGSGSTFNLPNPAGRVLGVIGTGPGLSVREQGDAVGEETHTLVEDELPSLTLTTSNAGAHSHTHNCNGGVPGLSLTSYTGSNTMNGTVNGGNEPDLYAAPTALSINSASDHSHTVSFGNGESHNNIQPTMFVGNMFIYCGRPNIGSYPYTPRR